MSGTISYWNRPRGFGFITLDDRPEHLFFHIRDAGPGFEECMVAVGAAVRVGRVAPGRDGRMRAFGVALV